MLLKPGGLGLGPSLCVRLTLLVAFVLGACHVGRSFNSGGKGKKGFEFRAESRPAVL